MDVEKIADDIEAIIEKIDLKNLSDEVKIVALILASLRFAILLPDRRPLKFLFAAASKAQELCSEIIEEHRGR